MVHTPVRLVPADHLPVAPTPPFRPAVPRSTGLRWYEFTLSRWRCRPSPSSCRQLPGGEFNIARLQKRQPPLQYKASPQPQTQRPKPHRARGD